MQFSKSNRFAVALACSGVAATAGTGSAATLYWDANGNTALRTDGAATWTNANQWTSTVNGNGGSTWNSGTPDDAVLGNGGTGATIALASTPVTAGSISLAGFSGTYTLGTSGSLRLNGTASYNPSSYVASEPNSNLGTVGVYSSANAGALTVGRAVTLGGTQTWINNSPNLVTASAGVSLANAGAQTLTVAGTGNTLFSTTGISNGSGTLAIVKDGTGVLYFGSVATTGSAVNHAYTGGLTISAGTVQAATTSSSVTLSGSSPLGGSGNAITLNGGKLRFGSAGTGDGTNQAITWGNNVTVGGDAAIETVRGGINTANKTNILGTLSIGASTLSVGTDTDQAGNAVQFGATTLTGNATFNTAPSANLRANSAGNITVGVVGETGGARTLTKTGAFSLTFAGANSFSGATNIGSSTATGGTLRVDANTAAGALSSSAVNFNNSGTLNYLGAAAGSSTTGGALTFAAGTGTVTSTYGTSGNTSLTFASLSSRTAGAAGIFNVSAGTNGTTNKIVLTSAPTAGQLIDKGIFFGTGLTAAYAAYDSGGYIRGLIYGTDSNAATTSTSGATLGSVGGKDVNRTTAAVTAQTDLTINTLRTSQNVTMAAGQTLTLDGLLLLSTNTITGGSGIRASLNSELVINASNGTAIISTPILANGTSSLTKTGASQLTLSSANTYTGNTTIASGTLQIGSGTTGSVDATGGIINYGTLSFGRTDTALSVGNLISGTGTVLQSGAGLTTLTNANSSYNGITSITGGVLSINSIANGGVNSALGAAAATQSNGRANIQIDNGTLQYTGAAASTDRLLTYSSTAAGGAMTLDASGGGAISFTNTGRLQTNVALAGENQTRTLNLIGSNTGDNTLALLVGDNGTGLTTVNKSGAGRWILTNSNTYTGATNVNVGTLAVNGSLAAGSTVTVADNAILGGTGAINGPVNVTGAINPGNSIGTLNVVNDVTWNAGDAWQFELGTSASTLALANSTPSINDRLNITGAGNDFLKGSGANWTFDFAGTGTVGWYKLVDWEGTTSFNSSDFVATNLPGGTTASFTVDPATAALYVNVVVPEPGALSLLMLAAVPLARRRRSA